MIKKSIIKGSVFIIIFLLITSVLNSIFVLKTGHRYKIFQGLYDHKNSYDVVFLGSSHMNGSINPNVLWKKYGITSFNYATGGQPIDVTYYLLKEVLKSQNKPIVVIDVYYLGLTGEFGEEQYIRYVLDNMKFSKNKVEAIINTTPKKDWPYYFFPIFKYHNRWKELTEVDLNFDPETTYYEKGFAASKVQYGKDSLSDISTKEVADIPPKTKEYLYKIIDLSKKEGFKLIFTNAPYDYTSTKGFSNWHKEPAKMFNKVAEIAKENNIPFINYNNLFDEIGFDFKTDMFNIGHVNLSGSNKISTHFGKFLKENYDLVDHRGDKNYKDWDKDYETYIEKQVKTK